MSTTEIPGLVRRPDGALALQGGRCTQCGQGCFPLAPVCAGCGAESVVACELSPQGELYAFSRVHVGPPSLHKPFVLGFVDLPENVRVLARIVGDSPRIGARVALTEVEIGREADGSSLRNFAFTAGAAP